MPVLVESQRSPEMVSTSTIQKTRPYRTKAPIPKGRYYIIKRKPGGRLGRLRDFGLDLWSNRDRATWFALYSADGKIDDWTFVNSVRRGNF